MRWTIWIHDCLKVWSPPSGNTLSDLKLEDIVFANINRNHDIRTSRWTIKNNQTEENNQINFIQIANSYLNPKINVLIKNNLG